MNLDADLRVGGIFKCIVRDGETHEIVRETPEFNNMVLDAGLSRMFEGSWITGVSIGKGTDEPTPTQTNLTTYSTRTTTTTTSAPVSTYVSEAAPYYWSASRAWRFPVGSLNGTYTEVGASWSTTQCWNRALIKNSLGVPEGLTVTTTEYLDVITEIRVYFQPSVQTISSVDGSNTVLGTHTVEVFPLMTAVSSRGAAWNTGKIEGRYFGVSTTDIPTDISTSISGNGLAVTNTYGSNQVTFTTVLPGETYNSTHIWLQFNISDLVCTVFNSVMSNGGGFKIRVTPPITKTAGQVVTYSVTLTINRYIP